jgi:predicted PurR-regulated permease PerM
MNTTATAAPIPAADPPPDAAVDSSADPLPASTATGWLPTNLGTLERTGLSILLLLALAVCYAAQALLVPLVLALLLSLLLSPAVSLLERIGHLPRSVGSVLVILLAVGALVGGAAQLAQPAQRWVATAPAQMKTLELRFRGLREPLRQAQEAGRTIDGITHSGEAESVVTLRPGLLSSMVDSTPRILGSVAAVILLVYFFLSSGNRFLRRMVEIAPSLSDKKVVVLIARDVQEEMSRYLVMVSLINVALGAATALALWLMGVPNPLLWGAAACLLNFVPYVGPLMTLLALALAGFSAFDTLGPALAVPGIFFVLTAIEGQLVTPTILGRRLSLDPTAVFVWLMLWGWMWGPVGILLAGPMLACLRIICQHVEALQSIGVLISDGSTHGGASAAHG